jgi:hypothetical protein
MHWQLWDTESANLVETFATEAEALQGVRELLAVNRPDLIDELVLGAMYDEGESQEIELPPALDGAALRSRLAKPSQEAVASTSHKVHERIRRWLAEEGWQINDVPVPLDGFNIVAVRQDGQGINIYQHKDHRDHITLSLRWPHEYVREVLGQLPESALGDIVWNIYRDVSIMGVDFYGLDMPSTAMTIRDYAYCDGLTKDVLMHRIHLVNRAFTLAMRTFIRALEAPGRSGEHALSSEDLRRIMRPVPQADEPLTAAS